MSAGKVTKAEGHSLEKSKSTFREYAEAIGMALLLALFIRTFIVQAFKIPSGSMIPTLQIGDHILVNKLAYGIRIPFLEDYVVDFSKPQHGDVVVFIFPEDRSKDFIKRVVGVAGDSVEIRGKKVYINGKQIDDPHAHFEGDDPQKAGLPSRDDYGPRTVPENHVLVMGRGRSLGALGAAWQFDPLTDFNSRASKLASSFYCLGKIDMIYKGKI